MGCMSTVDPAIAKRQREARTPSNLQVGVVLALLLVGGFLTGYGWGGFGWMVDVDTEEVVVPILVAIPLGMVLTIISSIVWTLVVVKRGDVGIMYGNAAVLLGGGLGVLAVAAGLGTPLVLVVVATALLVLAAGALALGAAAAASRRRGAEREDAAVREGSVTTATVSDKGYTVFHESDRILTTVTFTFTDPAGVQRWVQRPMVVRSSDPVVDGQSTRLWFDPRDPGNDKRIVVELARANPWRPRASG